MSNDRLWSLGLTVFGLVVCGLGAYMCYLPGQSNPPWFWASIFGLLAVIDVWMGVKEWRASAQ